jgi:hypothetical protein
VEEDWLEEGLLVPAKKKNIIKEKYCRRRFFYGPRRRCTTNICPTIGRNPGVAELLRWCTNASMGEWCSHTPTIFAVPNIVFAEPYATFLNHNKMWPSLEDTLQGTCKLLQPSKSMQTKWVKEMQTSLMCLDTFT